MNSKEYIANAIKTKSEHFDYTGAVENKDLIHAVLGMVTEAGELADIIKRAFFYGKGFESIDTNHAKEEVGDQLWYLALMCHYLNVSFEELMQANIAKLKARYPNKFSTENAYNRNTDQEREALINARTQN